MRDKMRTGKYFISKRIELPSTFTHYKILFSLAVTAKDYALTIHYKASFNFVKIMPIPAMNLCFINYEFERENK